MDFIEIVLRTSVSRVKVTCEFEQSTTEPIHD